MDKLEKQIIENRADLDRYLPDPGIWQRIQKNQAMSGAAKIRRFSGWAAIFILVITSTIVFFSDTNKGVLSPGRPDKVNDELAETEIYYSSKINSLIEEVRPILTEYPGLNRDLMMEINNLDSLYLDIKKDLKDNISNNEVIEALILNYRTKIQILEDMLEIMSEGNMNNDNKVSYEI